MPGMGTQQFQSENSGQVFNKISYDNQNGTSQSKPVIERGASWGYGETKLLLTLWSQDMVQRQLTNSKRTRHVWEKIAERIREHGYERSADQVRTRVFNMIAEYRRIMKNPTPERRKKCIFFDALHKIYQAKDSNSLENVIMGYGYEHYNFDPLDFNTNDENMDINVDDNSDNDERNEMTYPMSPSLTTNINGNINDLNCNDGSFFGISDDTLTQSKRCRFENTASNESLHNAQLAACTSLDSSASALLIDRMFSHLSKETEVMREWVNLERERLAQEVARRKEEKEREERREKSFLDVLTKFQERVFSILKQNNFQCSNTCQHQAASSCLSTNECNGEK